MKLQRPRRRDMPESTIPLINVVFLLLIFFMLAGRLSAPMPFEAEPPQSDQERRAGEAAVTVYVAADGRLAVGPTETELGELAGLVGARREAENGPVRVRADGHAEANRVIAVLDALREAEIGEVRLLTRPAEGGT